MQAGALRNRVTVQKRKRVSNSFGEEANDWKDVAEVYAAIVPLAATEAIKAESVRLVTTHQVTMRYTDSVTADCRLEWFDGFRTRTLAIASLLNVGERNAELQLLCSEITK
jgi:SPP1 family predicted phage head-tail adaptor